MKSTLQVINAMQAVGVIVRYAIGGAVGAIYYLETISTEDIDIFISIQPPPGKLIATMEPVYDYLSAHGYEFKGQRILIEGWPVDFLPAEDPLYKEALLSAVEVEMDGVKTWVMTPEHLMAIAVQLKRPKDCVRLQQFVDWGEFEEDFLPEVLNRHKLLRGWEEFRRKIA